MDEQAAHQVHEPPMLMDVGQFSEDTLGDGGQSPEIFLPFSEEE
ncbi:MAG: lasso RiPP family leader peptide-containing protein [Pseudonocardiaceae bacterium]